VFDERFPRFVLYVNDIDSTATRWKGVFLAGTDAKGRLAPHSGREAIVYCDRNEGKLELHLRNEAPTNFSLHDGGIIHSPPSPNAIARRGSRLDAGPASEPPYRAAHAQPSCASVAPGARDASVEIQRRLSFPCLAFPLLWSPYPSERDRVGRPWRPVFLITLAAHHRLLPDVHGRSGGWRAKARCPSGPASGRNALDGRARSVCSCRTSNAMPGSSRWNAQSRLSAGWRVWKIFLREDLNSNTAGTRAAPILRRTVPVKCGARQKVAEVPRFARSQKTGAGEASRNSSTFTCCEAFLYYFLLLTVGFILLFEVFTFSSSGRQLRSIVPGCSEVLSYFIYLASYYFISSPAGRPGCCAGHARHYDQEQ